MEWLEWLERIGELPAEVWLIPPVVFLALLVAVGWLLRERLLRRYRAIAARTGLTVKRKIVDPSSVQGSFRGRDLVMTTVSPRRPNFRRQWTLVSVYLRNPEVIGLTMWPQGALDNLIIAAGATEVEVGDEEFDRRFVIRSRDERIVAKMFADNRELRGLLVRANVDSVELMSSRVHAYYPRGERDPAHAELLFTAVTALADAIDSLKPDYTPDVLRVQ
jgi:hypothetical protein